MSQPLPIHRTAIVIGSQDYKEADRLVRLLTPENGRITALARSARRSNRRFGGAIDVGNRIDATLRAPKRNWWTLDSAELADGRATTRTDLERIGLLAYACEVCGQLAREDHPEPKLFGLLDMASSLLDAMTGPPSTRFRLGLEAKALTFAGVAPTLDRCVRCSEPPSGEMVFSIDAGGAHHLSCIHGGGLPTTSDWLEAVENARRTPLRDSIDVAMPDGPQQALAQAIEHHLGRALKSRSVLASLTGSGAC